MADYVNAGGLTIGNREAIGALCLLVVLIVLASLFTGRDKDGE